MKNNRNGELDLWKFIFSIMVILCHSTNMAGKGDRTLFANGNGVVVVEFFFLTSGILMAYSADKQKGAPFSPGRDTFSFMKRKLCGLMPNIYVAWLLALAVEHIGKPLQTLTEDVTGSVWELLFLTEAGLAGYRANPVCWYLSAMLLAMFLTWPLMRKYQDTYFYILAPLTIIFLMGVSYQEWKNFSQPHAWFHIAFKSLYRAIISIMLGSVLYKLSLFLRGITFTRLARGIFTLIEWCCYGAVIAATFIMGKSKADWLQVILLGIAVTITFSQISLANPGLCGKKLTAWLGEYSFSLFLGHGFWSRRLADFLPGLTYMQRLPIYLCLSAVTALFIMYTSLALRKWWGRNKQAVRAKFIVTKTP